MTQTNADFPKTSCHPSRVTVHPAGGARFRRAGPSALNPQPSTFNLQSTADGNEL